MLPAAVARRFPLFAVRPPLLPLTARIARPNTRRLFAFRHLTSSNVVRSDSSHRPLTGTSDMTFTQRVKHLIKSYGWYAIGVYAVISVVDFGVAFATVNFLGAEYVGRVATSAKTTVLDMLHMSKTEEPGRPEMDVVNAQAASAGGYEGLTAMIVLAYTIHKTLFLPVRVALTAGLTPKIVGWLGRRGWAGKEGTKRAANEMRERIRQSRDRISHDRD